MVMGRAPDPVQARAAATAIVSRLREAGHVAYFAGGCVRDELLGMHPTDYDVATDAPPQRIKELFPRTAEVGVAFGVVLVHLHGCSVEVATFRSEGAYSDARRPDVVHFSDPPTDAARRDFTINALFLDPLASKDSATVEGHVVDYVGGLADLRAGIVRAVGDPDTRLAEDHLRALRAVRFTARLGFSLDPGTAAAIRRHAMELRGVSRERIGEEIRRMLTHPTRGAAVELLQELGLDAPVLMETGEAGVHKYMLARTLHALGPQAEARGVTPWYGTSLAAWALDRGTQTDPASVKSLVGSWRKALMLSNDERDDLNDVLLGFGYLRDQWAGLGVAGQRRAAAQRWFEQALVLLGAWERGQGREMVEPSITARVAELAAQPPGIAPAPLITGDDLVALGLRPGPRFKEILDRVYDAQLEGRITTRTAALELARGLGV